MSEPVHPIYRFMPAFMFCIIGLMISIVGLLVSNRNSTNNKYNHVEQEKLELQYFSTKYELMNEVDSYIKSIAPKSDLDAIVLINECDKYNVNIKLALCQGQIESHFGTKGLAVRTNSVWNLYAYDSTSFDKISHKGKYKHPNESIEPYLKLLTKRYLVNKTELDLLNDFKDIDGYPYAMEGYEIELRNLYNNRRFNRIDSLTNELSYLKLKLNR